MDDETQTFLDGRPAEDDLAPLLDLAGPRPRLREEEVAPIRDLAREVFLRQAQRTARRRRLAWSAAAGLAASLLAVAGWLLRSPADPDEQPAVATLEMRLGEVSVTRGESRPADPRNLAAGTLLTTGTSGRAAVRLPTGASLRLDAGSAVRLDSSRLVTLQQGAVYVDSGAAAATRQGIEIATSLGSVRDIGTQFEARLLSDGLRVRVREGKVLVDHRGEVHQARTGGELLLRGDGSLRRTAVPLVGASWEWVQRVAPPFAIDGASLADFLDWVSRETGVPWRLAEPVAGTSPEEVVLHGSIAGLTAEESLAVVLPGCGYRHRRVGGELWLERAEQAP